MGKAFNLTAVNPITYHQCVAVCVQGSGRWSWGESVWGGKFSFVLCSAVSCSLCAGDVGEHT